MEHTDIVEHVDELPTETLVAAGLERRGETLTRWALRQEHSVPRVLEAWRQGWIIPRGHDAGGLLKCTLVPSLDPSHLDRGGGRTQGEYRKQPAALRDAERAYDAALAERDDEDNEPGTANPAPGHDEHAGRSAGSTTRVQNKARMTMQRTTEAT